MPIKRNSFCVLALAAVAATTAQAESKTGPYFAAQAGAAQFKFDDLPDLNKTTMAWSPLVGWQFTQFIGLEAGYVDIKKLKYSFTDGTDTADVTFKLRGWQGALVGSIPLSGNWFGVAKIGALRTTTKGKAYLNGALEATDSSSSTDFAWGAGFGGVVDGARLRLEYGQINDSDGRVNLYSVTVQWFLPYRRP